MRELSKRNIMSKDVILLLAASFFYLASPMLVTPLITGFSESLGAGAFIMGVVGGLTNLFALLVQPFAGGVADKISKYKLGFIGTVLLILACVGYVISVNPIMILLFRAVNGVGFAFCSVCFSTWLCVVLPPDRIGFGIGLYGMMNALAMAISPAIGVEIYQKVGYRPAFCMAVACAVLSLIFIQFCDDKGLPIKSAAENRSRKLSLIEPKVIPYALVIACFAIPYCATQSFIVRYSEARELKITVSLFFTIYAMALLLSRFLMRNLYDTLKFMTFLVIGSICAFLSIFFLSIMENDFEMVLGAIFMAGGYGLMCTVAQSAAATSVPPEKRGLANGTYYIGLNLGMTLGPMLGGLLYGKVDIRYFYPILMDMIPLCLVLYGVSKTVLGRRNVQCG